MTSDTASLETAIGFACAGETLVGVLTQVGGNAATETRRTGVLIVVGGPQYRAGSHRQFTLLARALADAGHPSLRFDVRGMGDSSGALQPFDALTDDIAAALDAAQARLPQVGRWVLWGLCDGASACLIYLQSRNDLRVQGLCLVNPWVRSEASLAQTHLRHYYGKRLLQLAFWQKLIGGGLKLQSLRDLVKAISAYLTGRHPGEAGQTAQAGDFRQRMAQGLASFRGELLLVLSGNDLTAKEFEHYAAGQQVWQQSLLQPRTQRLDLPEADHTLSNPAHARLLHAEFIAWLNKSSSDKAGALQ